ncbi:Uncharacterized protein HZ326_31364, partial [Fusarium oxysporum f. sp. albedinis]
MGEVVWTNRHNAPKQRASTYEKQCMPIAATWHDNQAVPSLIHLTRQWGVVAIVLLKTGDYSDLVISCGKDQYRVHKAIICPRSDFLKAACDGEFKEAQTGTIDLPDDDPVAVHMMIEYLYHNIYAPPAGAGIHRDGAIDAHLSDTEYDDEKEKRKRELYGATFIGNKRIKRLTALPEDSTVRASQPARLTGFAAFIASRESQRGSDRSRQERGSSTSTNSVSVQSPSQASPEQSSATPLPSTAPSPT